MGGSTVCTTHPAACGVCMRKQARPRTANQARHANDHTATDVAGVHQGDTAGRQLRSRDSQDLTPQQRRDAIAAVPLDQCGEREGA
jgi:hypothetical protein